MKHICTLSDGGYLLKGLTLYESISEHNSDFTLHYLCLDDTTYNFFKERNLPNLKPYQLTDMLTKDDELVITKNRLRYDEFCWALASYFCKELLNSYDSVLYCDSDLYFYQSFDEIYDEIGDKSIGIIRHRHTFYGSSIGDFNVGIVYFKNDDSGNSCVNFWWGLNKNKSHEYYKEYGTCGDQKYLELFVPKYGDKLCIIDETVGHGAPFNFQLYDYSSFTSDDKIIIYDNKKQRLSFIHFMKFKPNFNNGTYDATNEPHNQPFMVYPQIKELYDDYYNKSLETNKKYL